MGLSPLSPRNIRRMERDTGFEIAWGSVLCHGHRDLKNTGQVFRFWRKIPSGVELGHYNTKDKGFELSGITRDNCSIPGCNDYAWGGGQGSCTNHER